MDIICRTHSHTIKHTNVKKSDMYIIPHEKEIRRLVEDSFYACIHDNTFINNDHKIGYAMNIGCLQTASNVPYIVSQLINEDFLHTRLEYKKFTHRLDAFKLSKKIIDSTFLLFIRLRMFYVMNEAVHVLLIQRNTSTWDIHLVKKLYDHTLCLDFALTDPRMRSYLLQHKKLLSVNIKKFVQKMVWAGIGFIHDLVVMPHFWQIGMTSLDLTLSPINDPAYYISLQGNFDSHAVVTFYQFQIDQILTMYNFPKLFVSDFEKFQNSYSIDYMKEVLQCIPDMWDKAVTETFKQTN